MNTFLLIVMVFVTAIVLIKLLKNAYFSKAYYKLQKVSILTKIEEFKHKKENLEYKKKELIYELVAFSFVCEQFKYLSSNQKKYLKKIKDLLYIDLIAILSSIEDQSVKIDLNNIGKKNIFKKLINCINFDIINEELVNYEAYLEVKDKRNSLNKKQILKMQNIDKKRNKQQESIEKIFNNK